MFYIRRFDTRDSICLKTCSIIFDKEAMDSYADLQNRVRQTKESLDYYNKNFYGIVLSEIQEQIKAYEQNKRLRKKKSISMQKTLVY